MRQKLLYVILALFLANYNALAQEELTHMIREDYDADTDTYQQVMKEAYKYNGKGQLVETLDYYWQGTRWVLSMGTTYDYNDAGYLRETISSSYNEQTQASLNIQREVISYVGDRIKEQTSYEWLNNAWVNDYKTEFVYDNDNILRTYKDLDWDGTAWVEDERGSITYDALQKIAEITTEEFDDNVWTLYDKTTYLRDPSTGRITDITYEEWDATGWINDEKTTYATDENGNQLSIITYESYDGVSWTEDDKTEYSYDFNTLMSKYNNPFNVNNHLYNLGVDEMPHYNKVVSSLDSDNENAQVPQRGNASWEVESRTIYYYSDDTMGMDDLSQSGLVSFYPNPVKNDIHINIKNVSSAGMQIYDVQGRLVLSRELQGGQTSLNMETLRPGMYLLKIITEKGFASKRITKN